MVKTLGTETQNPMGMLLQNVELIPRKIHRQLAIWNVAFHDQNVV